MSANSPYKDDYSLLADLLRQRRAVIADHALREADPVLHLHRLQEASEAIAALHQNLALALPPQLRHFLERSGI